MGLLANIVALLRKGTDEITKIIRAFFAELKRLGKQAEAIFDFAKGLSKALKDLGVRWVNEIVDGKVVVLVTQNGEQIFEGSNIDFFDALQDFNKSVSVNKRKLQGKLDEIASGLSEDILETIKKANLTVKKNKVNIDLLNKEGVVVFRGISGDIPKYLDFINKSVSKRKALVKAMQKRLITNKLKYDPKKALDKGYDIPLSDNKTSPDFDGLTEYLYKGNPKFGKVKIKVTGSRDKDFKQAFEKMGIKDSNTIEEISSEYTWHHLDDLDENLECTIQLVLSSVHKKTYNHLGSAKQFQELLNIEKYL